MQYILMKYPIYTNRTHNKSLHPIWSVGPAFASCSCGAANAAPPAQTGELNRYVDNILFPNTEVYSRET